MVKQKEICLDKSNLGQSFQQGTEIEEENLA